MATLVRLVHVLRASSFPQSTIVRAFYGIALLAWCITLIMTAALPTPMWFGNSFTPVPATNTLPSYYTREEEASTT